MITLIEKLEQAALFHHGGRLSIRKSRSTGWIITFGGNGETISFGAREIEKAARAALQAFPIRYRLKDDDPTSVISTDGEDVGLPVEMQGEQLPL